MDDIAPLRQLAASVTKPTRARPTNDASGAGQAGGRVRCLSGLPTAAWRSRRCRLECPRAAAQMAQRRPTVECRLDGEGRLRGTPAHAAIKPFDGSNVFLFSPAPAYRVHYQPMIGPSRRTGISGRRRAHRLLPRGAVRRREARDSRRGGQDRARLHERSCGRGAGRTRRRAARRRPAVGIAGQNRHEPLRLGSPVCRRAGGGGDGEGGGSAGRVRSVAPGSYKVRLTAGGVAQDRIVRREDRSARREGRHHRRGSRRADEVRAEGARRDRRSAAARSARAPGGRRRSAATRPDCRACWIV